MFKYQCSKHSDAAEIEKLFDRAFQKQEARPPKPRPGLRGAPLSNSIGSCLVTLMAALRGVQEQPGAHGERKGGPDVDVLLLRRPT